jgi:hypothetical protein
MKRIGGLMVLLGAGSAVLGLVGMEFRLLMWIELWGPAIGWMIRGALVVVGAGLWLVGHKQEAASPAMDSQAS